MKEKFSPDPIYVRLKEVLKPKTDREMAKMFKVTLRLVSRRATRWRSVDVEPLNSTDPNGKLVVAIHDGKAIIRRFEKRGQLAHFTSLQAGPAFSLPIENVSIAYLLKGIFNSKP